MKKHTEPMTCGTFYHIYNRGINGENLFKEPRNYPYFLRRYAHYIQPVAETYAYCLLKNHFHLLVRLRSAEEVLRNVNVGGVPNVGGVRNPADVSDETAALKIISNQFAKLFNSYAQAINKAHRRTGGLFENVFRRIPVDNDAYFVQLVYYIHANPEKHGLVTDFRTYPHSSYRAHLSNLETQLKRGELLHWFGSQEEFEQYHLGNLVLAHLDKFEIEVG